jgi:hypothetical protein
MDRFVAYAPRNDGLAIMKATFSDNPYRCGSRSKLGMPSGMWWKGCLSTV